VYSHAVFHLKNNFVKIPCAFGYKFFLFGLLFGVFHLCLLAFKILDNTEPLIFLYLIFFLT